MAEGSEGRTREDELDLGPEDDVSPQPDHDDTEDYAGPSPEEPVAEELDTIDQAQDQASEKTAEPADVHIPHTPPAQRATPGSLDETASTPDDSPSLHVSPAVCALGSRFLIDRRNPGCHHRAAVHWHSGALREPVLAQRIARSIFVSNRDSLRPLRVCREPARLTSPIFIPGSRQSLVSCHQLQNPSQKHRRTRGMLCGGQNCERSLARHSPRSEDVTLDGRLV